MIIDSNIYFGHWPHRKLYNNNIRDIVRLIDENKIDKGIISSLNSVFYKNCQAGNEELYEAVKPYQKRFILFATINPTYTSWKEDLKLCIEKYKMKGVRIHPHYHNYKVTDKCLDDLVSEIKQYKIPIAATATFEDQRQKHWLDQVQDMTREEIYTVVKTCKDIPVIINNVQKILEVGEELKKIKGARFYLDTAFAWGPPQDDIQRFISKFGAKHLVLGTHMPFRYPTVGITRVNLLETTEQNRKFVFSGNLVKLFK